MTKSVIINEIAGNTDLTKKEVSSLFDEFAILIEHHIKKRGPGQFTMARSQENWGQMEARDKGQGYKPIHRGKDDLQGQASPQCYQDSFVEESEWYGFLDGMDWLSSEIHMDEIGWSTDFFKSDVQKFKFPSKGWDLGLNWCFFIIEIKIYRFISLEEIIWRHEKSFWYTHWWLPWAGTARTHASPPSVWTSSTNR